MSSEAKFAVVSWGGRQLLDALLATVRFEIVGELDFRRRALVGEPCIFVLWHGRLLPLTYLHRRQGIATLISPSADGEYIARVVRGWGYETARGSSSREGAAGLRQLLRWARDGRPLAITPDGPRGPARKMKPGAIIAAQRTGLPLVPVTAGTDRGWWVASWDRFLVPRPFARVRVAYGSPVCVDRRATESELEECALEVEATLNRLTDMVDRVSLPVPV
ncbi:MAG TPA: lysophospholipid acyltransferase family protein [Longimicrobiales bacterium]|nr:lysophospholipid acyltransferase family protein [Longimicrobiales bacterium]